VAVMFDRLRRATRFVIAKQAVRKVVTRSLNSPPSTWDGMVYLEREGLSEIGFSS